MGANARGPGGWKAQCGHTSVQNAVSLASTYPPSLSASFRTLKSLQRASDHHRRSIISRASVFSSGLHSFTPPAHSLLLSPPSFYQSSSPLFSKTANLASVRAWRTLSADSTAELVVAWSAKELSPLVSVAMVTQGPACLLLD